MGGGAICLVFLYCFVSCHLVQRFRFLSFPVLYPVCVSIVRFLFHYVRVSIFIWRFNFVIRTFRSLFTVAGDRLNWIGLGWRDKGTLLASVPRSIIVNIAHERCPIYYFSLKGFVLVIKRDTGRSFGCIDG